MKVKALFAQSCLTLCDPMGCSPPGSSVHGILQARILEWVQFSLVSRSCLTLHDSLKRHWPGLPVHHQLPEFTQTHVHRNTTTKCETQLCTGSFCYKEYNMVAKLSDLSRWLLCIKVFSNESTFRMKWPKYWSFSFHIIPSKEIQGMISFRMD